LKGRDKRFSTLSGLSLTDLSKCGGLHPPLWYLALSGLDWILENPALKGLNTNNHGCKSVINKSNYFILEAFSLFNKNANKIQLILFLFYSDE